MSDNNEELSAVGQGTMLFYAFLKSWLDGFAYYQVRRVEIK